MEDTTVKQALIDAKVLIGTPEKWTKHYAARDHNYLPVREHDATAVCFCTIGALSKVCGGTHEVLFRIARNKLQIACKGAITTFNDSSVTTHEDVMDVFDKAIARCDLQDATV